MSQLHYSSHFIYEESESWADDCGQNLEKRKLPNLGSHLGCLNLKPPYDTTSFLQKYLPVIDKHYCG